MLVSQLKKRARVIIQVPRISVFVSGVYSVLGGSDLSKRSDALVWRCYLLH